MSAYKTARNGLASMAAEVESRVLVNRKAQGGGPEYGELGASLGGGQGGAMAMLTGGGNSAARHKRSYDCMRHWVYVCVHAIAKRLAGQPVTVAELDKAPAMGAAAAMYMGIKALSHGAAPGVTPVPEHPVNTLVQKPNPVQRKSEFIYCSAANLFVTGECYWVFGVDKASEKWELWAVPTNWIVPDHSKGLFSGFFLKPPGTVGDGLRLEPNQVARTYFPDPSNLKAAISPVETQMQAIRVDAHIQDSQEQSFANGPFPNVLLHVGKNIGPDGKVMETRPVLTGKQRAQLVRAVRSVWMQGAGQNDPGIIDGLIENVTKLSNTNQEMDWLNSGEQIKKRIFAAFGLNPIVTGEIAGANRAQATEAEKNFCSNVINPVADALSVTLTDSICRAVDDSGRLVARVEPANPIDEDLRLRQWTVARTNNDVTKDEFRATVLGLPPDPNSKEVKPPLASTVGGIQGAVAIMSGVAAGMIARDSAIAMFEYFFDMQPETAAAMTAIPGFGMLGLDTGGPPTPPGAGPPAPADDDGNPTGDPADNDDPMPDDLGKMVLNVAQANQQLLLLLAGGVKVGGGDRMTRSFVKAAHVKQAVRLERQVQAHAAAFFANSLAQLAEHCREPQAPALTRTNPRPRLPA